VNKGGTLIHTTKPMTSQAVLYILRKRATEANVAPFEPTTLRRTWIGDLLEARVDISTVARWPATLMSTPPPATTAGRKRLNAGRRTCSTSRMYGGRWGKGYYMYPR